MSILGAGLKFRGTNEQPASAGVERGEVAPVSRFAPAESGLPSTKSNGPGCVPAYSGVPLPNLTEQNPDPRL
jgi:hypothetical protein